MSDVGGEGEWLLCAVSPFERAVATALLERPAHPEVEVLPPPSGVAWKWAPTTAAWVEA